MVVLNKIYTKTGDAGETALGNGSRVAKHSMRVTAYGTVDETNATVGMARLHATGDIDAQLTMIQNDLFDLHLCRTVSRRAERLTVELATMESVNPAAVKYLNRLSDWFFQAARIANNNGIDDVLWIPGANR